MEFPNLNAMFNFRAKASADKTAFGYHNGSSWVEVTWKQFAERVRALALSLLELGIQKGDKICVISDTRPEWELADKAILMCGGVTVGIYQTLPPAQILHIVAHSDAKAIFIENAALFNKVIEIADECPQLRHLILFEPKGCQGREFLTLADLEAPSQGRENSFGQALDKAADSVKPEDTATLIYTSGTTGPPKGAMITHKNLLAEGKMLATVTHLNSETDSTLTWLPMAHIYQRAASLAVAWAGIRTFYARSIDTLLDDLANVRPTIFYSVPRIFEKAYSKIQEQGHSAGFPKKTIFFWSMGIGRQVSRLRQKNKPIPPWLNFRFAIARKLVFSKIKEKFGGNIRFIASSSAPIAREILEFFHAADITTVEAYGATETTAAITVNTPDRFKFGTVGWVPPGMELKIASDGEILARGDMLFAGYYKEPEKTRECFTEDGFYMTGDVGEMDGEGFLRITDRKKDIIVTSGGKNVAPINIENLLKQSQYISQAMVHGDRRKYLTCLLTLDPENLLPWAKEKGLPCDDWNVLCETSEVQSLVTREVESVNSELAKFETIKYFKILPEDFTIENGFLTPTLKLKRREITKIFMPLLDSMYSD